MNIFRSVITISAGARKLILKINKKINTVNVTELQLKKRFSERLCASEILQPALQSAGYKEAHLKHFHTNPCSTSNKQEFRSLGSVPELDVTVISETW